MATQSFSYFLYIDSVEADAVIRRSPLPLGGNGSTLSLFALLVTVVKNVLSYCYCKRSYRQILCKLNILCFKSVVIPQAENANDNLNANMFYILFESD